MIIGFPFPSFATMGLWSMKSSPSENGSSSGDGGRFNGKRDVVGLNVEELELLTAHNRSAIRARYVESSTEMLLSSCVVRDTELAEASPDIRCSCATEESSCARDFNTDSRSAAT